MNWQTLLSLGDSITIGSRSYLGYPEACCALLKKTLGQHWNAVNFATAGFTAIDLARSMDQGHIHLSASRPGIASLLIGTNDAKTGTTLKSFTAAYDQVLIKSRLILGHSNIVAIRIPALAEGMMYPYLPAMNERIAGYNATIEECAKEHGARTMSFTLGEEHFFDGVHLNEVGVHAAAQQLAKFILKDKRLADPADLS